MSGLLGSVYSFGDSLKRKVRGLLSDPLAQIQLNMNQAAGGFNDAMRSPATDYARAGGVMADDPSTQAAIRAEADRRIGALMNVMPGGLLGATVWHGSPHKFAKFDASKIGTGEGAQAYGHGLYLADSPEVAKTYSTAGKLADHYQLNKRAVTDSEQGIAWLKKIQSGEIPRPQTARGVAVSDEWINKQLADYEDVLAKAKTWSSRNEPNLYKVDLPDPMIARMLDWDKPLSQQGADVQRAAAMFGPKAGELTGQELYKKAVGFDPMVNVASKSGGDASVLRTFFPKATDSQISQAIAASKKAGANDVIAAQMLRDAGIPGIRYLDGGSRGAGSGTSNFVVFPGEEGLLTILERNGVPLR